MTSLLSSADVAIARAFRANTLRLVPSWNARLGLSYVSIEDDRGLIEVASDLDAAQTRVREIAGGRSA